MGIYIALGFMLAFLGGVILFYSFALSEDTAMAMIAGSILGLILLVLRTLIGISTVNTWVNVVFGFIAYFFAYYLIFKDFKKTHPKFKSSFFPFLHLRATTAKITFDEMSADKTVENMLEISGLTSGEKTEAQKILDEPISGSFWGWSTWIINLALFTVIAAGAAENKTIGEYFSKFFSGLFGEECLTVIGALVVIIIIVFVKNKFKKPEPLVIKIGVPSHMSNMLRDGILLSNLVVVKKYTPRQAFEFIEKNFNDISLVFWARVSKVFSDKDLDNWKNYLNCAPGELEQWETLEKFYSQKTHSNFNKLILQIIEYYINHHRKNHVVKPHEVMSYLDKTTK